MLTRAEFDAAVKDALRYYTRADLLIGSPLLETRIAAARGPKPASVVKLQQVLAEAAETIFADERDQRRRRVLELTYFQPASKQEAVAERLSLPFSTYRRYLTAAVTRLSEWLWHEEQALLQHEGTSSEETAEPTPVDVTEKPDERPRLSNPSLSRDRAFLAAAEALVGDIDSAKQHLAEYYELDPGMTVQRFATERSSVPPEAVSPIYLRGLERVLDGLRRAGMPER
jgi:hypothetical protein